MPYLIIIRRLAYREGHSTGTALSQMQMVGMVGAVLLDFSAAVDVIELLFICCWKLKCYGFTQSSLEWMESYCTWPTGR